MNKNFKVKTNLGNKELVKARCIACNIDYFEIINKNKPKPTDKFLCEECSKK